LADLGIALLPNFSVQLNREDKKLVQVLPQWRPVGAFAEQLFAIRPYSPHVPRAVTALVVCLKSSFANGF
jgi:DNA-binding transcriptional LysR family regulator